MVEIVPARRARQASERDWNRITPSPSPPRTTTRRRNKSRPHMQNRLPCLLAPAGNGWEGGRVERGGVRLDWQSRCRLPLLACW